MFYSKGGQRRTIEAPCGWKTICHPREANGKYKIHTRNCKTCSYTELPEYSREVGLVNGWKGLLPNGDKPNTMLTTAFVDGIRNDVFVKASNMEDAIDDTKLSLKILQKMNDDEEKFKLFEEICRLEQTAPCPVASNKYSGCEMEDMSVEKLRVILKVVEKQIDDYNEAKEDEEWKKK